MWHALSWRSISRQPRNEASRRDKGKLHGEYDVAAIAYKPDGSVAARFSDAVKLDFDTQQQADAFLKTPYHYENQLDLAPGTYNLRMAVSPGGGDTQAFGKAEMPLKIDPWNGQTLSASGLALSHDSHPAADMVAGLDGSLLEGHRPLVANGTEIVPTGTSQFQTGERGFVYFEAYEPLLTAATARSGAGGRSSKPESSIVPVVSRNRIRESRRYRASCAPAIRWSRSFRRC